jgi:2-dehydropantoate 2-reductase
MAARGSSFLLPLVAAMECAGWTFAGLRSARWAGLAAVVAKEALTISTSHLGISPGPLAWVLSPTLVRLATRVVPLVAPMDFEAFLRSHFSKVGDQTLLALDLWISEGQGRSLPVAALTELAGELRRARGAA